MGRPAPTLVEGSGPRIARGLVVLCLTAAGLAGCARPAPTLVPTLDPLQQLKQDVTAATMLPGVQRAAWGIVVQSLDRNERILELNPRTLLVPASTAKLVSLASAVDAVGWNYRYETAVVASAPIVDGTIHGDLLIVGSGDPSIGGRAGADFGSWIDALKAQGLRRIDGRVIGDDDAIEEPRPQLAWAWDDLGYATGGLFGALNLAENRMTGWSSPSHLARGRIARRRSALILTPPTGRWPTGR
jgi:D-alanyl-D-alanine carboxypeptidase/D-alanyl-D-alanine-endopeptidase (penicillin-binding protein 4)